MDPITLRLPEDLAEDLAVEADERGYSSRSEYVRRILRNRSATDPNTQPAPDRYRTEYASAEAVAELRDRVATLEERLENLEVGADGGDAGDTTATAQAAPASAANGADVDGGAEPASAVTGEHDGVDELPGRPAVRQAVERVADGWDDSADRLAARKAAAATVLEHAVATGEPVGKSTDAVEAAHEEYPVPGQSYETWWRKNVRPVLKAVGQYDRGTRGYRVRELNE